MDTLKDFLKPEVIWFVVGVVLLIMEFAVPGLIIFFFGIGAWIVALICFLADISLNAQLLIFISSSVLCLLCLRKWLKSIFIGHVKAKQNMKEDLADFVGQKAVVINKITPKLGGKVEFHGTNWDADADEEIADGVAVEITGKENLTLKVKPL